MPGPAKSSTSSTHTSNTQTNKNKLFSNNNNNKNVNRTQSVSNQSNTSNEVFSDNENDDFQLVKINSKRNLSSTSSTEKAETKKPKPVFVSTNRYNSLHIHDTDNSTEMSDTSKINSNDSDVQNNHSPLPPPIFIRNVNNFIELRNQLIKLIGSQNFSFKSSANNLKISTSNSESYREAIKYLKQSKAEYHTYQARENKAFRIVIRNLHPSTPTSEVGVSIEEIGYSVRQVTNIIHKTTKLPLPIFFVDLEPAQINNEIFKLTSLLHTKITVEEPHKKREIIQCSNCQEYGHSKSYCAHPPRCVRCADFHPTQQCTKSKDTPATCALCGGDHTANYRGCSVHKSLQRFNLKSNPKSKNFVNYNTNVNKQGIQSSDGTLSTPPNITDNKTFPNLTQNSQNHNNSNTTEPRYNPSDNISNNQLSSFLIEFKQLINPLIQLLTTVINKLILNNDK